MDHDFDIDAFYPEDECVRNGDPFLAKIVAWDDYLGDCENNATFLGGDEAKARREMTSAEQQQLGYEVRLLSRWYALEAR